MTQPPITLTRRVRDPQADGLGVIGPRTILEAAFRTRTPVTIEGTSPYAGERVYLGATRRDHWGLTRKGMDYSLGSAPRYPGTEIAVYLIDWTRMEEAPRLAADHERTVNRILDQYLRAEVAADEEERRHLSQ